MPQQKKLQQHDLFPIQGVIIAGGQSKRFGQDKAALTLEGQTLLTMTTLKLAQGLETFQASPTLIIGAVSKLSPLIDLSTQPKIQAKIIPDLIDGKGPLGGLYTALGEAQATWLLVVAVDMPLIQPALLSFLATTAISINEHDLTKCLTVVPLTSRGAEPLLAVYKREGCLEIVKSLLQSDKLSLHGFLRELGSAVHYVPETALRKVDPDLSSFTNVNFLKDWQKLFDQTTDT